MASKTWRPGLTMREQSRLFHAAERLTRRLLEGSDRYVFAERPRCPSCGSADLKAYRSTSDGESTTRYVRCQQCGAKFILVLE